MFVESSIGQHGHRAVGKIDAGAAQAGLGIDGRARPHVVAHVGDVHLQGVVPVGQPVHPHGIVEIARRLAVDGHDIHIAEIAAALQLFRRDHAGNGLRLLQHFGRKLVRQVMLADHDFHIYAKIVGVPQNFDHAAHRTRPALRILQQFHVHHHAVQFGGRFHLRGRHADTVQHRTCRGKFHAFRNIDPLLDAVVMRHHVLPAAPDVKLADHRGVGPPQHFDDLAIGAAVGFDTRDANYYAVAMHGLLGRFGRNENVALYTFQRPLGYQKSVTIAVHIQAAHGEFAAAGGDRILTGAQLQQIAAGDKPHQGGLQFLAFPAFSAQFANQLLEVGPGVRQVTDVVEKNRVGHTPILLATPAKLVTSIR